MAAEGNIKPEDTVPDVDGFRFYLDAFVELSSCRQIGMAAGPIPFTSIVEYAKVYEVEDLEEFIYVIRAMDNKFLMIEAGKHGNTNKAHKSRR